MKTEKNMVRIKLFRDNQNYSGDVFAAVNGESYLIQRGVAVEVPDYIAEVLETSQREDENALMRMEKAEKTFIEKAKTL